MASRRATWVAIITGLLLMGAGAASSVTAADDLLPDLKMAQPYNVELTKSTGGRDKLRFGTIVWNVGDGPFEVRADNRVGDIMTNLDQVVHTRGGNARRLSPPGGFAFYAGDGHDHWHVSRFVVVALYPTFSINDDDNGPTYARRGLRKIGFCLTDLVRAPAELRPQNSANRIGFPVSGCGVRSSESLRMGISVGYGDDYKPFFNQQSVDVTGLPAGTYRLCVTANKNATWLEKDADRINNMAWVDIEIDVDSRRAAVVGGGESDCGDPGSVMYGVGG